MLVEAFRVLDPSLNPWYFLRDPLFARKIAGFGTRYSVMVVTWSRIEETNGEKWKLGLEILEIFLKKVDRKKRSVKISKKF